MSDPFTWTDEAIARFRELFEQGLSHSAIGRELGITKNASIGKARRLKLTGRGKGGLSSQQATVVAKVRKPKPVKPAPAPALIPIRAHGGHESAASIVDRIARRENADARPAVVEGPFSDRSGSVRLLDLREPHCRWPFSAAGETRFCGCQKVTGKPYCEEHLARAFSKGTRSEQTAHKVGPRHLEAAE